jgi:hypothetical protein
VHDIISYVFFLKRHFHYNVSTQTRLRKIVHGPLMSLLCKGRQINANLCEWIIYPIQYLTTVKPYLINLLIDWNYCDCTAVYFIVCNFMATLSNYYSLFCFNEMWIFPTWKLNEAVFPQLYPNKTDNITLYMQVFAKLTPSCCVYVPVVIRNQSHHRILVLLHSI